MAFLDGERIALLGREGARISLADLVLDSIRVQAISRSVSVYQIKILYPQRPWVFTHGITHWNALTSWMYCFQ